MHRSRRPKRNCCQIVVLSLYPQTNELIDILLHSKASSQVSDHSYFNGSFPRYLRMPKPFPLIAQKRMFLTGWRCRPTRNQRTVYHTSYFQIQANSDSLTAIYFPYQLVSYFVVVLSEVECPCLVCCVLLCCGCCGLFCSRCCGLFCSRSAVVVAPRVSYMCSPFGSRSQMCYHHCSAI